jgi:hypothetical protein
VVAEFAHDRRANVHLRRTGRHLQWADAQQTSIVANVRPQSTALLNVAHAAALRLWRSDCAAQTGGEGAAPGLGRAGGSPALCSSFFSRNDSTTRMMFGWFSDCNTN